MGDGRTKALEALRVGDVVYGTRREGAYRRWVRTPVLAHWRTVKPAFRLVLSDGTVLVASGDHRFLTRRGWKHVTDAPEREGQRAHLTPNDVLLTVGRFVPPTEATVQYRTGYLCGMVRGDGLLRSYRYERIGRRNGDQHRFRLALVDDDGLERAGSSLAPSASRPAGSSSKPQTGRGSL
jgi:hypothetical protein